ncbi:hypothetical protein BDR04DRAFT_1115525 [Suillus decipiens]|nr:hypothetical protein BDR04DRAFT_1115525 [Suillus decipiens]
MNYCTWMPLPSSPTRMERSLVQDSPKDDPPRLKFQFKWQIKQHVSSLLFNYHQGNKVIRMLQQLDKDKDLTGTSLFLQVFMAWDALDFEVGAQCILDIYRGPLP